MPRSEGGETSFADELKLGPRVANDDDDNDATVDATAEGNDAFELGTNVDDKTVVEGTDGDGASIPSLLESFEL